MKKLENLNEKSSVIPIKPWSFLLYAIKPHKIWAVAVIFVVIFVSVIDIGTSYLFKFITEAVEAGDKEAAMKWGLVFPLVILLVQILHRINSYFLANLTVKTKKSVSDELFHYVLKHSHNYFTNRFAGAVASKLRNIGGVVDSLVPDLVYGHLSSFVSFLTAFIILFTVDVRVAGLFIVLIVVLLLVNKILSPKKAILAKKNAEVSTKLQGRLVDTLTNISSVRQYAKRQVEITKLKNLTSERLTSSLKNWLYTDKILLVNVFVLFVFTFLITWLLVKKWQLGEITSGDFLMVIAMVTSLSRSLLFLGRAFNSIARAIGELQEALLDLLVPYEILDKKGAKDLVVEKGEIIFEKVKFSYENKTVFTDFNLQIKAGERVGLVGVSGAGKSTLVSLLLRQYDLGGGKVCLDGQDISGVTQDSLRKNIAIVPQESVLFHRSIWENIAYGKEEATEEEILLAAKRANVAEFVEELPETYKTFVGERGVKLSGGQKQRIAIARAIVKDAPILILDEATSALDSESEVLIQGALQELMKGKTVIAIAHRLSTLREMDRIVVLEKGKIVESGTHQFLKEAGGVYAKLWKHQSGGFLDIEKNKKIRG